MLRFVRLVPTLALLCAVHTLTAQAPTLRAPGSSRLDSALAAAIGPNSPGAAMIVVKDGQVVYLGQRGRANLSSGQPMTTATPIVIASISKQFTAAAVMRLAERGRLAYDDRITKYLPELGPWAQPVTIRQLLTHTSGVPDHLDIMKDSVPGWTNADVVALLQRVGKLDFTPGERSGYSNSGYVLLALAVERITGQSLHDHLASEFFTPFDMTSTGVIDRMHPAPANLARGYLVSKDSVRPGDYDAFTTGAGGVYSTAEDLMKWDRAYVDGRVVADSTVRLASTPARRNDGRPTPYGFGWLAEFPARGPLANVWYVASFGNFKGYQGMLKRIPEKRYSVVLLTNSGELQFDLLELAQSIFL